MRRMDESRAAVLMSSMSHDMQFWSTRNSGRFWNKSMKRGCEEHQGEVL